MQNFRHLLLLNIIYPLLNQQLSNHFYHLFVIAQRQLESSIKIADETINFWAKNYRQELLKIRVNGKFENLLKTYLFEDTLEAAIQTRSSFLYVFCKIGVLSNFGKLTKTHPCRSLFFNKAVDPRPATLLKTIIRHRYFPVNFAKFLRTLYRAAPVAASVKQILNQFVPSSNKKTWIWIFYTLLCKAWTKVIKVSIIYKQTLTTENSFSEVACGPAALLRKEFLPGSSYCCHNICHVF